MEPTFKELFGETYIETPSEFIFKTVEFDRVGLSTYVVETPMVLVALHEMIKLSFVGVWVDENGDTIGDLLPGEVETVIYNYINQYDTIKCIPLNKRSIDGNVIWTYLWQFPEEEQELVDIDIDVMNDAITITGDTVSINKSVLDFPATVSEFVFAFAAYLLTKPVSGVVIRDGIFIDITTTDTQVLDPDLIGQ